MPIWREKPTATGAPSPAESSPPMVFVKIAMVGVAIVVMMVVARDQRWSAAGRSRRRRASRRRLRSRPRGESGTRASEGVLTGFPNLEADSCTSDGIVGAAGDLALHRAARLTSRLLTLSRRLTAIPVSASRTIRSATSAVMSAERRRSGSPRPRPSRRSAGARRSRDTPRAGRRSSSRPARACPFPGANAGSSTSTSTRQERRRRRRRSRSSPPRPRGSRGRGRRA